MHLVNVFLHLVNTLLLFAVLRKMTGSLWASVFVVAAFALHPMHVESVAWIAERKDVLSTFFLLLTLVAYASYVKRPSAIRYLLSLVLFALGLMAKPMLVTLPFILLLLDYWPLNRIAGSKPAKKTGRQIRKSEPATDKHSPLYRLILEKIPFAALSIMSSVITFLVQQSSGAMDGTDAISLELRLANAFLSYMRYIGKMFWPENLAVFYPAGGISFQQVALCVLLLTGVTVLVVFLGRKRKYLPVGWFWFVGTLVPVIGLVQVGAQAYADRYSYIPYIGLFIMIAWGLPELLSKWPYHKVVLGASMVIVLVAMGICSYRQGNYWNNSITLFSHAVEVTENNCPGYNNLGSGYGKLGRYPEAIEAYKQAIKINPDYARAYYNLGAAYGVLGRCEDAAEAYRQVIRIKPDYADAYNNLGVAYHGLGRYEEAIDAYKSVLKIRLDAQANNNLGITYGSLGRYEEAIEAYKQAIKIKPNDAEVYNNLGIAYGSFGRYEEAIEALNQAIKIRPDYADANNNLGVAYFSSGRYEEAAEVFSQTIRLKPDYADAYNNLGEAYGGLGHYEEAIKAYKQAIRIRPNFAGTHYSLGLAHLKVGNKTAAMEEYKILKTLNTEMAEKLFNGIGK
jgi:protein O-mannosyl-transferase